MCPEGAEPIDEVAMLGHFSDTLSEMAESLMDLEDGYFKSLREVIIKIERALRDVPVAAQGPLIANTLSTTFQFQMSV